MKEAREEGRKEGSRKDRNEEILKVIMKAGERDSDAEHLKSDERERRREGASRMRG